MNGTLRNYWRWARRWHPQAQAALDWACGQFPPEVQQRGLARSYYEYLWLLDEILRERPGGMRGLKVADIGCGVGVLALALRHLSAEVWVLDRFDEYDDEQDNQMGSTGDILGRFERHGLRVSRGDFLADGLPDSWPALDMIMFLAVIEHVPQSPCWVLEAMRAKLRPGGHLIVTTLNVAWVRTRLRLLFGRTVHYPLRTWWETPFYGHIREYTRAELMEMLRWAGFDSVRTEMSNWVHVSSRLPRTRAEEPERWTTRLTLRSPREWVMAASLLLVAAAGQVVWAKASAQIWDWKCRLDPARQRLASRSRVGQWSDRMLAAAINIPLALVPYPVLHRLDVWLGRRGYRARQGVVVLERLPAPEAGG